MKHLSVLVLHAICCAAAAQVTTLTITMSDSAQSSSGSGTAQGIVFEDGNGDGEHSPDEQGISGIAVSDGENIVLSNADGEYQLPLTSDSRVLFITRPSNFERAKKFYYVLDDKSTSATSDRQSYDFALKRATKPDSETVRFVQTSDIHIGGEDDRERFISAISEINKLNPPADFVVATGDLVNRGSDRSQFDVYKAGTDTCQVPWLHVFGNHDANRGVNKTRVYASYFGPDYYSADYGDLHLIMMNSVHRSDRQDRWIERDLQMLGKGKKILAFQHYAANESDLARLERYHARAIFTGHWHSNKMTSHINGLASINHPTFIMGGIDGSPSSFRIITISGEQINSEFRFNDFSKHIWITYPQAELTGPERLLASIYDTSGDVAEARYRLVTESNPALAQGSMKRVSPLSWMASLAPKDLGLKQSLPREFAIRVRATNNSGEQWEANHKVSNIARVDSAPAVHLKNDWPEFMGNAQRTGSIPADISLPLSLRWFTPTHGSIDYGSPVLFKERIAIGTKDRDNLINNGVALINAKSGKMEHFIKTDSMVNHSPAFVEDFEDGPGKVYAVSAGGTIYVIDAAKGTIISTGSLGDEQQRWIYSSPAVQGDMIVLGSSPMLMALHRKTNDKRWVNNFGVDWISSYASPSLAGDIIVMGACWLDKGGKRASIYGLDVNSGQVRWTNDCPGISGSIAVAQGRGYAIDYRDVFKVIDLSTGDDLTTRGLEKGWGLSTPAVDGELVVVPTGAGTVHAYDTRTLDEKWKFEAGESIWNMSPYDKKKQAVFSSPTMTKSLVFIGCSDGKLYALDKKTGTVRWYYDFGVPTLATPCISGNTLYTAAYDGNVYAFTAK
jgi:outer membrane protein assembly factor BamB